MRELIYSRRQIGTVFNFYIDNGILTAETVRDGEIKKAILIKGLPELGDLRDEVTKEKNREILENSYFVGMGCEVHINARMRGGWKDEVHRGYEPAFSNPATGQLSEGTTLDPAIGPIGGTYGWARWMGLKIRATSPGGVRYFNDDQCKAIADACAETDATIGGRSGPLPVVGEPRIHFNLTEGSGDGDVNDSRIMFAVQQLCNAIRIHNTAFPDGSRDNWMTPLGRGLHALQDVFAHTSAFVSKVDLGVVDFSHHILTKKGEGTDDVAFKTLDYSKGSPPSFVGDETQFSQRYSDTKTATCLYLGLFLSLIDMEVPTASVVIPIIAGVAYPRIRPTNEMRFYGLLQRCMANHMTIPPSIKALFPQLPAGHPSYLVQVSDLDEVQASLKLFNAIMRNNFTELRKAVSDGGTIVFIDQKGTLRIHASEAGSSAGWTALHWAVWHGNENMVQFILQNIHIGAGIDTVGFVNRQTASPSEFAIFGNGGNHTALHILTYRAKYDKALKTRIRRLLLEAGAGQTIKDSAGRPALPEDSAAARLTPH